MIELLTPRLRMRRATRDDLADLHAILSNASAMRYWMTLPHTDLKQSELWLNDLIGANPETSDEFVLEYRNKVIGRAGIWRVPEIAFMLHPDYWGQGFAFEALSRIVPRVFASFPIPAIEADVDPRNSSSLALLGKLGFRETRRAFQNLKVGDEWCDSVYLALNRPSAG